MHKKIIFVGGTARSGSTLLDMILSNDPKAMSLGEIIALFQPTRKHHFEEIKKLKTYSVWNKILKDGEKRLYHNLNKYFPDINIYVDSSKDPFWFKYHSTINKDEFDIRNILIYKNPYELANSFIKRGKNEAWIHNYIHYHRKYFSLTEDFVTIAYKDLINIPIALEMLCRIIGIQYTPTKVNYWERDQTTFFGSNSVKSHNATNAKKQIKNQTRRDLIYDEVKDDNLFHAVNSILENKPEISLIENHLIKFNVLEKSENDFETISYDKITLLWYYIKQLIKRKLRYYFPVDIFKNA